MSHREQRRFEPESSRGTMRQLMLLCVMLLLVLLLMSRAKDPHAWTWLTSLDSTQQPSPTSQTNGFSKPLLVQAELPPDVFVGSAEDAKTPVAGLIQNDFATQSNAPTPWREIDPVVFEGIRDKTRQIPRAAYFHLLDVARRVPPEELENQARSRVLTFAHFSESPERYRGQPVFLKGHVRRMTEINPIDTREGFEKLYEGWLFTEESQDNPYVIIVSRLPEDFPLGGSIVEDVSFTGFFLKLWAYRAGDGDRYAPLLIGHRIVWHPRRAGFAPSFSVHLAILAAVVSLIAAVVGVTWYARRIAATTRQMVASHGSRPSPEAIHALGEMAAPNTEEFLADMTRQAEPHPPGDSGGN